ncbi:SMC family ATPase [Saccharopolyspora sp. 6T]|uniref:AAA family ATPase n=1 Tax=Saccharopolyspora sp. 6T TaxID=2877238 RepID=UPI001CD2A10F|nr:SMC family ATPase [Saccharopolyspora sp. 6T]MCA1185418.1 SMC family ATPase [Saccharopolyspora sp. 6T]
MRLHQLAITAFGPYRDRVDVDFDALGTDGLFLLHGDTGAGKTSLLDAICFALYGAVPGAREQVKQLRCDTAADDVATSVELELTVQGHRLRVVRSPKYDQRKKRGEGTTTRNAKASLIWIGDAPGDAASEGSSRIDEVNRSVQRLLGMSVDQFTKVVLLPQGEFANFLRAETTEREKLLEKLFGTQRFADVERWFVEHRRERGRDVEAHQQQVRELLARAAQVVGQDPENGADERHWLESWEKHLAAELDETRRQHVELAARRDAAEQELTARRELADKVRRVRGAHAELAELDAQQTEHRRWRTELDAAQRVLPVLTARRAVTEAETELDRAAREAAHAETGCPDPDAPLDELRRRSGEHRERAGALAELLPEARKQDTDRARLAELDRGIDADERATAELDEQQAALPDRISTARTRLDEAKEAATRRDQVEAKVEELADLLGTARAVPAAQQAHEQAAEAARRAVDEHQRARETVLDLRDRRLAGMAAELAAGLTAGEPCPVCGSADHPEPRSAVDDSVGAEDEERAQQAEQRAQARRDSTAAAETDARRHLELLRHRLGDRGTDDLAAETTSATERRDAVRALADQTPARSRELAELESAAQRLTEQRGELDRRIAAARTERTGLAEAIEARAARLDAARGEHPDIDAHRAHLLDQVERLDRLVAARTARDDADARLAKQREALRAAAVDAGFADVDEALRAERDESRRTELADALTRAEQRRATAQAALGGEELFGIDADTEVGLDAAAEAATTAREAAERAAITAQRVEQREQDVRRPATRLRAAWDELGPALAEHAELEALADVVNGRGQNARKMSLRSYVLAARLEEVAVTATRRLRRMSDGRYSFVHSDAAGARGTRGGLGLDVLDDYSGQTRSAKTLSGGESFMASLSLALGLADVVAAETGGALLDTLFIDEGFGTLDANTLDLVMDTLDELRAGGRVIGLVSHVDEMRQRIGVRLRIRKSRDHGSTIELDT